MTEHRNRAVASRRCHRQPHNPRRRPARDARAPRSCRGRSWRRRQSGRRPRTLPLRCHTFVFLSELARGAQAARHGGRQMVENRSSYTCCSGDRRPRPSESAGRTLVRIRFADRALADEDIAVCSVSASAVRVRSLTHPAPASSRSAARFTPGQTTAGTPQAIASTRAMPKFSCSDGSANRRAFCNSARRSAPLTHPRNSMRSRAAPACASRRSESDVALGPVAGNDETPVVERGVRGDLVECLDQQIDAFLAVQARHRHQRLTRAGTCDLLAVEPFVVDSERHDNASRQPRQAAARCAAARAERCSESRPRRAACVRAPHNISACLRRACRDRLHGSSVPSGRTIYGTPEARQARSQQRAMSARTLRARARDRMRRRGLRARRRAAPTT